MIDYALRDYQENAVKAVMQAIQNGNKRISLNMAPGTGKTFVLAALVEHLIATNIKIWKLITKDRNTLITAIVCSGTMAVFHIL